MTTDPTAIPDARPPDDAARPRRVMLARRGDAGATDEPGATRVHLLPLPPSEHRVGRAAVAYCAARLPVEQIIAVDPGERGGEDLCVQCFTIHTTGGPPAPVPGTGPFSTPTIGGRAEAAREYVRLGWPLLLCGGEIRLDLAGRVAIALPVLTATDVTELLVQRRCAPAVLAHPAIPSHRVILASDRDALPLAWPPAVRRLTTSIALPPTVTPEGQVLWARPPEIGSPTLCRESDVITALRAVLARRSAARASAGT